MDGYCSMLLCEGVFIRCLLSLNLNKKKVCKANKIFLSCGSVMGAGPQVCAKFCFEIRKAGYGKKERLFNNFNYYWMNSLPRYCQVMSWVLRGLPQSRAVYTECCFYAILWHKIESRVVEMRRRRLLNTFFVTDYLYQNLGWRYLDSPKLVA